MENFVKAVGVIALAAVGICAGIKAGEYVLEYLEDKEIMDELTDNFSELAEDVGETEFEGGLF